MPTYEYECQACGHVCEFFQSVKEGPKRKCPACGKLKLRRQIGAGAGFLFKGSGFYTTDYRSADYKAKAKAESEGPQKKNSSKGGTSEGTASKSASGGAGAKKSSAASSA